MLNLIFLLNFHVDIIVQFSMHQVGRCKKHTYIYIVLCFSIGGGDARAPAPFHTLECGGFLERSLMC